MYEINIKEVKNGYVVSVTKIQYVEPQGNDFGSIMKGVGKMMMKESDVDDIRNQNDPILGIHVFKHEEFKEMIALIKMTEHEN